VTAPDIESRLRSVVEALPAGLRDHVLRVEAESRRLAAIHGVDPSRARLAALGHDLVRHLKGNELLALASRYEIVPDAVELASPILTHGPIAARILALDYGIEDGEVLDGIDCHTTGRAGMTALEKVLFVADKIDGSKIARSPELAEVRDLALSSLDEAVLRYLDFNLEEAVRRRWQVHPRSLEARNEILTHLGLKPEA
jgi:predicted HD superfamily hydrolase involved in NAD metabolism